MTSSDQPLSTVEKRRKRLRYQSWHRGMKEVDFILGRFADAHLETLSEQQLDQFEIILGQSDPDIYAWISGRRPLPADLGSNVMKLVMNFKFSVHDSDNK
jgi:antitoxin CptB